MPAAEARVPTENASRYLSRLYRHAGKMVTRKASPGSRNSSRRAWKSSGAVST
jgi:hypothetical protein